MLTDESTSQEISLVLEPGFIKQSYTFEQGDSDVKVDFELHGDGFSQQIYFEGRGFCLHQTIDFESLTWERKIYYANCTDEVYSNVWELTPGEGPLFEEEPSSGSDITQE